MYETLEPDIKELQDKIRNLEKTLHGYETTVEQKRKLIATNEAKLNGVNEKLNSLSNSENRIQGANIPSNNNIIMMVVIFNLVLLHGQQK